MTVHGYLTGGDISTIALAHRTGVPNFFHLGAPLEFSSFTKTNSAMLKQMGSVVQLKVSNGL